MKEMGKKVISLPPLTTTLTAIFFHNKIIGYKYIVFTPSFLLPSSRSHCQPDPPRFCLIQVHILINHYKGYSSSGTVGNTNVAMSTQKLIYPPISTPTSTHTHNRSTNQSIKQLINNQSVNTLEGTLDGCIIFLLLSGKAINLVDNSQLLKVG